MDMVVDKIKQWKELICTCYSINFLGCLYSCPIYLIFFIYSVGDSMLDAVLRPNISQLVCFNMFPDRLDTCRNMENRPDLEDDIQKQATLYIIYHKCLSNLPVLVLGLFCGAWSDIYGRKLPMVLPSIGTTFAILLFMSANVHRRSSLAFFLSGSLIQGCFGKVSLFIVAVNSYAADVTNTSSRTNQLGLLASMQFFGLFMGSLIAGLLLDNTDVLTTYCTASFMHALVVVLALWIVKETVAVNEGTEVFPCRTLFRQANLKESLMVLVKKREFNLRRSLCGLIFIMLLNQTCQSGLTDVTLLYTELPLLSWPTTWFGYLTAVSYAAMGIILLIILPILSNVLKLSDPIISMLGLGFESVRFIILTWSTHSWMIWMSVGFGSLGELINSPARSLLSKLVHEDEVGKIFAVLASGETLAKFPGLILTTLYGTTLDIFPRIPFLVASVLYLIMSFLMLNVHMSTREYVGRDDNSDNGFESRSQSDEYIQLNNEHDLKDNIVNAFNTSKQLHK